MRFYIWQILLVLVFVFAVNAEQNKQNFLQTQWTTENGLPQNSIVAITQTPDGYLWLGTFGGLARFDGVRFKIYTSSNTPALKSNRITALTTDREGTLWIGTERGEIICHKAGKFNLIDDGKNIKNSAVTDLFVDDKSVIWVSNAVKLQTCTPVGCKIENSGFSTSKVRQDKEGKYWIISENKLGKYENGKLRFESVGNFQISNFEVNPNGGVWVSTDEGVGIYQNGIYKPLIKGISKNDFFSLAKDVENNLWFTVRDKLYKVAGEQIEKFEVKKAEAKTARITFFDREGNMWLGRIADGLIRFLPQRVQTLTAENGFPANSAGSIVEDSQGNIWIATNKGLVRWKDGKIDVFAPEIETQPNYWHRGALFMGSDGTLWTNTSEGLQSYRDGKFTLRTDLSTEKTSTVNNIFEDSRKHLWFGCQSCGIHEVADNKIIATYTQQNGLLADNVNVVAETRDGAIWFGTAAGVSRLQNGEFTKYTTENGLSNDYVRDIYEDSDGTIWIGTYGGGLNRLRDGKFTPITTKDGLFDDIVSRILVDDDNNFWMLGNRGIFSVNRQMLDDFANGRVKQVYCSAYTTADGMMTSEGNGGYQNAGLRASDGRLWFPMINGVVIIDPKQKKMPPPKPIIEEVIMAKKPLDFSGTIELDASHEDLEISYTGISFRKPEQTLFRYKMDGFDKDWVEAGTRRTAYYPRLPFGEHTFQVIAANGDGIWSDDIAEFKVVVHPPFYRTWWFIVFAALLIILLLWGFYKYRNYRFDLEKKVREEFSRRLLNAQEGERRKIAADIHDNLGQQLLVIKNWASYCLGKIHNDNKIRPQLVQIEEAAAQVLNEVRTMAKTLSPYHLDKAGLTNTLRFMVKQVADSSDIAFRTEIDEVDGVLSKDDELNLYRIVQEALNNIIRHSKASEVSVILERNRKNLQLWISDNGIGFPQGDNEIHTTGVGISGMRERAQMSGGELSIQSAPGKGTRIFAEFKLENNFTKRNQK